MEGTPAMKIAVVNTLSTRGGAARAAYRLHRGLRTIGVDSHMLVMQRDPDCADPTVSAAPAAANDLTGAFLARLDRIPLRLHPRRPTIPYSLNCFPNSTRRRLHAMQPDVVHLQWVGSGFVPVHDLARLGVPTIWTLHDMWAFTGGCHYAGDCTRYQERCGACPQLASSREHDLSRWTWQRKRRHWAGARLTLVAPSRWLADCARESSLCRDTRVEVIPNGIDVSVYRPYDRETARRLLNLPLDRKLILFGAVSALDDPRKGFDDLQAALRRLAAAGWAEQAELAILGAERPADPPAFGFEVTYLGHLHDDLTLALAYSAADVVVTPSRQEAFGLVPAEAQACGAPVVAFATGGLLDIVEHECTGYLARPFDAGDLAAGIEWVLGDEARWQVLSQQARARAGALFALETVARRHVALYEDVAQG